MTNRDPISLDIDLLNNNHELSLGNDLLEVNDIDLPCPSCHFYSIETFNNKFDYCPNPIILSLNCRSIVSKLDELKVFLSDLKKSKVICVLFQEIWDFPDHFDFDFSNFNFYFKKRALKRGGGVGLLVRSDLSCTLLPSPFLEGVFESIAISVNFESLCLKIINIYRPPNGILDDFHNSFLEFYDSFPTNETNSPIIVGGDFNIDLLCKNENSFDLVNNFFSQGLINVVSKATRIVPPSKSLIDHIFVSDPSIFISSGVITDSPSDHFWTFAALDIKIHTPPKKVQYIRNFSTRT